MKSIKLFFVFLSITSLAFSQQSFTLSGTVKDNKGEVLPGAGVYVSGYKIATVADNNGAFTLNLKPGNYDILVQIIGYKTLNKNIVIVDKPIKIDFILVENATQLAEVTIKPDPNRQHYINIFKNSFIGTTPNSEQCQILNPQVLKIDYNKADRVLSVKTDQFLIIENKALGYKISYLINDFQYDYNAKIIYYEGYPTYEDLKGSNSRKKKWAQKRLEAYNGSPQHFFSALYANKTNEEGFIINKLIKRPNPGRPADSIITKNIKRLSFGNSGLSSPISISASDSLNYWIKKKNMPKSISILNSAKVLADTLSHSYNENIKSINFTDVLFIIYTKEKEDPSFSNRLNLSISRPINLADSQVTLINLQIRPVYFYRSGAIYNTKSMLYEGYWAWEKVADSVPMDYLPPK